jgi:radical SAM superfamily enzyme YgiQ (UPF0313 family)
MIQRPKRRLVLFLPHRADPAQGVRVSADLTPLELLQIAAIPDQEGYEIVLIDAMIHDDYERRIVEACDGALLFASSCILGYQITHGAEVARMVRARFPDLPIIWGGWFPSVCPELYLDAGIADAVGLGQGEITFWEVVQALESGEDLATVPGLVVQRDGQAVYTDHRPVVGFDKYPKCPWHLLDYEAYVERQNEIGHHKVRHKYPDPWDMKPGVQLRGFSFYSSFGCPEPCTFCCSPMVTDRRWKAIPGADLAEQVLELHDRYKFNILRFQDANFGVAEKRSNEFCTGLVDAGAPFWWNGTYEIETIARYKPASLDLLASSRLHMAALGAEAGSQEQQERIKKKIHIPHVEEALEKLFSRGIQSGTSWIIGYPGESRESMLETIRVAAQMKHKFPRSASDIFPFRPIPGTEDFTTALGLGYQPPKTLEEWGACLEYKLSIDDIRLPMDVFRLWKRYGVTSTFFDGLVEGGSGAMLDVMKRISGWRLRNQNYTFPIEQKVFHWYSKATGRTKSKLDQIDRTSGVTPHAPA